VQVFIIFLKMDSIEEELDCDEKLATTAAIFTSLPLIGRR
jgi:hypothetical protein